MDIKEIRIAACRHTQDSIFLECRELDITIKAENLVDALTELVELLRQRELTNAKNWLDNNWPFDRYANE